MSSCNIILDWNCIETILTQLPILLDQWEYNQNLDRLSKQQEQLQKYEKKQELIKHLMIQKNQLVVEQEHTNNYIQQKHKYVKYLQMYDDVKQQLNLLKSHKKYQQKYQQILSLDQFVQLLHIQQNTQQHQLIIQANRHNQLIQSQKYEQLQQQFIYIQQQQDQQWKHVIMLLQQK